MSALPETKQIENTHVRFTAFGAPDTLEVVTGELPEPGPGEVRIAIEAASVQFTDTLIRRGMYPDLPVKPPVTPGYDVLGRVDAIGEGVEGFAVGDRVADLVMYGSNARYIVRPAAGLVPVPETVDAAEAVTLVLSWVTAYQALHRVGELRAGERLLVIGGNGSVGLAAIALARRAGAEVYATARPRHHAALRAMGAIALPRDGWQDDVRELGGVDVVLDGVAADGFRSSRRALRAGGRLVGIGMSAQAARGSMLGLVLAFLRIKLWSVLPWGLSARFYSITEMRKGHPDRFREDLAVLFAMLERGEIAPAVAEHLTLSDVADAHRRLEAGGLTGKLVLDPWA